MNKRLLLVLLAVLGICGVMQADKTFFCDFENPAQYPQWRLMGSRNAPNTEWGIGSAQTTYGMHSLYVSTDQGQTAGYEAGQYGIVASIYAPLEKGAYRMSFDWKALGIPSTDQLWVAVVPAADSLGIMSSEVGNDIPRAIKDNLVSQFPFSGKEKQWKTEYFDFTLYSEEGAFVCFYWQANSLPPVHVPGGCVDNIQIAPKEPLYHEPTNVLPQNTANGFQFSWQGDAANYEVLVYDVGKTASPNFEVMPVNGTTLTLPYPTINEGAYRFRVRPVAEDGTPGLWTETRVVMVYDPVSRCFDYMNFYLPEVECMYGSFYYVDSVKQVLDSGYTEMGSMHTIHYMGETDPRTYTGTRALSTLPKGETLASVRLGGKWYKGGGNVSQTITYSVPIQEDMGVIEFKYAVVAQSGGHVANDQPRFTLEILDEKGAKLPDPDGCLTVDFRPPMDENTWLSLGGEKSGWYQASPSLTNFTNVYWRDWTMVAFNVGDYIGKTVKIRITNRACSLGEHWSYIYFTLGCSDGQLKRSGCDDPYNQYLVAPEGFAYEWTKPYNMSEPFYKGQDDTAQKLYVKPDDTNVYECRVYNKETGCGYVLIADGMFRLPRAAAEFKVEPRDCKNTVVFKSNSAIYTTYTDDYGQVIENKTDNPVDLAWQFGANGEYGVATADSIVVEFPAEGGTFPVVLVATMPESETECTNVYQFNVTVPPLDVLDMSIGEVEKEFCDASAPHFNLPYVNNGTAKTLDVNLKGDSVTFAGPQGVVLETSGEVRVDFPPTAPKEMYQVEVVFHGNCVDSIMTTECAYFPADVIAHRWDDVLAVRRPEYISAVKDGGEDPAEYEYTAFQWYKNGQPIPGATNSFIYVQEKLDLNAVYEVELTRAVDGQKTMSCPANLSAITDADKKRDITLASTYLQGGAPAEVMMQGVAEADGEVRVYNMLGVEVSRTPVHANYIQVDMPRNAGVYLVEVILKQLDGTIVRKQERVVVK